MLPTLMTSRLILRDWREEDVPAFAAMNADKRVARYLPSTLTEAESRAFFTRISASIAERGFGLFAVAPKEDATCLLGFCGLSVPRFAAAFTPCVEIGWRLRAESWNHGFATEAARAALGWGFAERRLTDVVSFTTEANRPSRRVMEKLGMHRDPAEDFLHPALPPAHPLAPHVLYRLRAEEFRP